MTIRFSAGRAFRVALAGLFALVFTSFASLAQTEFEGTWHVKDSKGNPFEIVLSADGSATGSLYNMMKGTWKEEGGSAVITWNTGWTTVIAKDGDAYRNDAYEKGKSVDEAPTTTSEAHKG